MLRLLSVQGNPGALHDEGQEASRELEAARGRTARTIGAHADEIIFTSGGTEANNLAIIGTLRPLLREHGELHAITSAIEHPSVLEALRSLQDEGLYTTELSVDSEGLIDLNELKEAINDQTVFVSLQYVNSEIGTIEPVREVAKVIRQTRSASSRAPIYFHVDAAQAPLWLPLSVEKLSVDFLTLDAQKIMGPKGVGALFARRGTSLEPIIYGGGQEGGLRSGTPNVLLAAAFAVALEEAQKGVEVRHPLIAHVRNKWMEEIMKCIPEARLNGPTFEHRIANNLNFSIPGLDGEVATIALNVRGIAVSTRSACSEGDADPSHVLQAIGLSPELSNSAIRMTLLPNASEKDARRIAQALQKVAERYKTVV